jgi:hypothetical protein
MRSLERTNFLENRREARDDFCESRQAFSGCHADGTESGRSKTASQSFAAQKIQPDKLLALPAAPAHTC